MFYRPYIENTIDEIFNVECPCTTGETDINYEIVYKSYLELLESNSTITPDDEVKPIWI